MPFQRNNHYVPYLYLKRFGSPSERVPTYRVLVAHNNVPMWQEKSIKGVAYHAHLYTRIAAGVQTDEIERWLNTEFESPAEEVLLKVTTDARLSPTDWKILVRFLAAQDVRTPARLAENLQFCNTNVQAMLDRTLQETLQQLEAARKSGQPIRPTTTPNAEYIPLRVTREIKPGKEFGTLQVETLVGRRLWFFNLRSISRLSGIVKSRHKTRFSRPLELLHLRSELRSIRIVKLHLAHILATHDPVTRAVIVQHGFRRFLLFQILQHARHSS